MWPSFLQRKRTFCTIRRISAKNRVTVQSDRSFWGLGDKSATIRGNCGPQPVNPVNLPLRNSDVAQTRGGNAPDGKFHANPFQIT